MTAKNKQKKHKVKAKRKARKKENSEKQRQLAFMKYLAPYLPVIEEEYKPKNISLYRWMHNPQIADDFKPQIFQDCTPSSPEELKVPPVDAPKEVILEYVSGFTLSNYVSVDAAVSEWKRFLSKRLSNAKENKRSSEIAKWIEKKGQFVVKVDYTPETAIVGPQDDGIHKQAFLYEGIDVNSLIDKTFQPIKIELL